MNRTVLVTGGCGFIGSAVVRQLIAETRHRVVNVDCLTYAASEAAVAEAAPSDRYVFERVDIRDMEEVNRVFDQHRPDAVIHLAAESHVDRSIDGPAPFIQTNIVGTYHLLEAARAHAAGSATDGRALNDFRFVHVSTDEVYGDLGPTGRFTETSPYQPSSPYSASKASADHLARAWHRTFDLPVIVTNCSNNYGPWQYPEKLIPVVILKGLRGDPIPVYGDGSNVRDWLHVEDHARALRTVLDRGEPGQTYNVGASCERTNLQVVRQICEALNEFVGRPAVQDHNSLVEFVVDRPGHDRRYAIDPTKIEQAFSWSASVSFEEGVRQTVQWYLNHLDWCEERLGSEASIPRRGQGVGA